MFTGIINKAINSIPPGAIAGIVKAAPPAVLRWKQQGSFREVVRYAYKKSKFYRERFDSFGIDPNKIRFPPDLKDFYTTPIDIIEHAEDFLCQRPHTVFESSGTTGRNKRVYYTQDELDAIGKQNAMGFSFWGIGKNDRLVNAFDFCIWIPGMVTQKGIEKSLVFGMGAGKVDPMEVYKRIKTFGFNVVLGEPTWLIKLTEIAEKNGPYPLKLIIGGAEEMPDAARPWMEKVWLGAKIMMVYASVESGGALAAELGTDCRSYHINENDFLVEIADKGEDGYGEVAFTTLSRKTMPLIRYRNRDISRIIEERCPCGIPFRRLARMRGRSDEMVVASGGNLYPLMFEDVLKDVDGITSDWQIVFKLNGIKEIMEFNLEQRPDKPQDAIKKQVYLNIQDRYPDLWKNLSINIFETEFVYHEPGAIRADKRKLLRLVDKRYAK